MVRYFEFIGADEARGTTNSSKFWQARVEGSALHVTYGKIGSDGTTTVKEFPTPEAAETAMGKAIAEKTRKGYLEVNATAEPPRAEKPSNSGAEGFEALNREQPVSRVTLNELSCAQCGETVAESDRFCSRCGAEIKLAPPSCGQCGFEVKSDARFCGNCGLALNSIELTDDGTATTPFSKKCEIIAEFYLHYASKHENFARYYEVHDISQPLAYLLDEKIVKPTPAARELVEKAWQGLLALFGRLDGKYSKVEDLWTFEEPLPEGLVDWIVGSLKRVYEGSKTKRVELRTGKASDFVFSVEVDSGTFDYCFSVALVDPEQLMGPDYTEFSEDDTSFPGQRIHFFQPFDLHTNTADLSALVTDALQDVSTDILQLWITETDLSGERTLKQDWVA
jgi:predicted DNA-binding WGR domain protein/predicted Zn-ribbon and HTH transcriptional regulator